MANKEKWRELVEYAWTGLNESELVDWISPFDLMTQDDKENPDLYLLSLMRRPENFAFTAKILFDIDLLPYQTVILQQLWKSPFPILLASRGAGKCKNGNSLVITNKGIVKLKDLIGDVPLNKQIPLKGYKVLGQEGFVDIDYGWRNGMAETKVVKTRMGYELEITHNDRIKVLNYNKTNIEWKYIKDLQIGDVAVLDRSKLWHDNQNIPEDLAYLFGLLVGDGGYTIRGRISLTTADEEILNSANIIANKYWNKTFRKASKNAKYDYVIYSTEIWDKLFNEYGFSSFVCAEKNVPASILNSSKESVAAFLTGLFDTDGSSYRGNVQLSSKSEILVKTVQMLLLNFSIAASLKKQLNKQYNQYYYKLNISGSSLRMYNKHIGFNLSRKQQRLSKACSKINNDNIDVIPKELCEQAIYDLRNKCLRKKIKHKHIKRFSSYKLKLYDINYQTLSNFLDAAVILEKEPEYVYLKSVLDHHYIYDPIIGLTNSQCDTYELKVKSDTESFICNGFITHNTWAMALYAILRATFLQGRKIVMVAAGFRQSKNFMSYVEDLWHRSAILQDIMSGSPLPSGPRHDTDRWTMRVGYSTIVALPLGDGQRIRGERANDTIIDEFSAIQNVDIIERVIGGFSVVSSSPAEKVKHGARIEKMKELGLLSEERANQTESFRIKNQQIISGTAYYSFNHFAKYHTKWKKIIESKGDLSKLQEVFTNEEGLVEIPDGFDWRDYSVIRIPVTLLPKHYMDMAQVARARATMDTGIYSMEYLTLHSDDSKGFFRASLINSCVANPENIERWKQFGMDNMKFVGALRGKQGYKYVMGVDTASERDNFAIVILELHENHRRIVHCWTFNRAKHKKLVEEGLCQETDFYGYGARKIRELMEAFPVEFIAMDFQGGGLSVSEALHSVHNMKEGEQPIWPIIKEDEEQDTDNYPGLHIIEPIQFANSQWTKEANHGMKKDFEDKKLIFPMFDSVALIEVQEGLYDTTEECMMEIEEIKNELITIVHTQTPNGTERWDTPEIKLSGSKKGRQLKDRYSALLMANAVARNIDGIKPRPLYTDGLGGFVGGRTKGQVGPMYSGPEWFTKQINENNYGFVGSV